MPQINEFSWLSMAALILIYMILIMTMTNFYFKSKLYNKNFHVVLKEMKNIL